MAVEDAVAAVDEIEMGVDVDEVHGRLVVEGADAGDMDRMIAAEHDRQGARREHLANAEFDVGEALDGIGVNDVRVPDIDDPHPVGRQVGDVVLEVVGAGVAEGEQGRGLADRARAETGAGAVLGAHVEGRAEHRDLGVDPVPVEAGRLLGEGAMADEGKVQAAFLIASLGHVGSSPLAMDRRRIGSKPPARLVESCPRRAGLVYASFTPRVPFTPRARADSCP